MGHLCPRPRRARPARVAITVVALAAILTTPALATPGTPAGPAPGSLASAPAQATPGDPIAPTGPATGSLASARADAARLEREVARLDVKVETLAEAYAAAQARLEGLIQAAHRHQAELERSELALQATRGTYARDIRDLYARGPLAPLELLLAAGDMHELALARGVASGVLDRDVRALASVGLATGTVRARVAELGATQAETLALRQRLAGHQAAIGALLATRKAMLATARAEVRALVRAEQRRQEAARRAMVAAAAARARTLGFAALADVPPPNRTAAAAVRTALGQIGKPYRWGATGPGSFDCSGLVRFAYADAGLALPRTSRQQWSAGRHVEVTELRPGDLVFWANDPANPATIHHVGIHVGQGLMVHAPHTGALVRVD
ncbi:MAG TPA: NlpC/P60 family protein, partial [Actinomycetes bacterium]|nr:NlpC/P60 family protein [Actinomycetes bacterium]